MTARTGKLIMTQRRNPAAWRSQDRDQPGGDPQGQEEPGEAVDPREGGPERWEQGQGAEQPGGQPAAHGGRRGPDGPGRRPRARKISRFVSGISQTKWRLIQ